MSRDVRTDLPAADGPCDHGAIRLALDQAELTLPRLVWLVEQRGFRIQRLDMAPAAEGFRLSLEVTARAPHYRLEVLKRQIDRLVGVRRLDAAEALSTEEAA
jgi:acetolactate synthase regulatory subunit